MQRTAPTTERLQSLGALGGVPRGRRSRWRLVLWGGACALALAGCPDDPDVSGPQAGRDASLDAGREAGAELDAGAVADGGTQDGGGAGADGGVGADGGAPVDPCESAPCENGGYCWSSGGRAFCTCPADYEGERCERAVEGEAATPHGYDGLHGYIGYQTSAPPAGHDAGMGFYSAVWPLTPRPLANFQIGLAGSWILPNNRDNADTPLCPEGTRARAWSERGPTWDSVFQTVEGGIGFWANNQFRYGSPKFSMNGTPQCYDYEVGSPGWGFFHGSQPLPDDRLGLAQLSNRLLIPPDGLTFSGRPNGELLGYTWMALPLTPARQQPVPTGEQSWTCFLNTTNFRGPIAFYVPETWSKIAQVFDYPFDHGRGLDARPGIMGGGAMEINTVPYLQGTDGDGTVYTKIPQLQFPVDGQGDAVLVRDVTYYSKRALYDAVRAWRDGGAAATPGFDDAGAYRAILTTWSPRYDQAGVSLEGIDEVVGPRTFGEYAWGVHWEGAGVSGQFPQYFKQDGARRVAVAADQVPAATGLSGKRFPLADHGRPYAAPLEGAWASPGPTGAEHEARLVDGTRVVYRWYRFVDQPTLQQYAWSAEDKARLQALVEELHRHWTLDAEYMAPPSAGSLVTLDPGLIVTPPPGLEVGYVPVVVRQESVL